METAKAKINSSQDIFIVAGGFVGVPSVIGVFAKCSFTQTAPRYDVTATSKEVAVAVYKPFDWHGVNVKNKVKRGGWVSTHPACITFVKEPKKKRTSTFDKSYIKGNIAVVKYFAGELATGCLLLQLKRQSSTSALFQWKTELRKKGKFCCSYSTAINSINRMCELGFARKTKKYLYLKSYDEITELCGGDPRHGRKLIKKLSKEQNIATHKVPPVPD